MTRVLKGTIDECLQDVQQVHAPLSIAVRGKVRKSTGNCHSHLYTWLLVDV